MRSTVQLVHTMPDGTTHIDWMFAPNDDPETPLTTFRVPMRLDRLPVSYTHLTLPTMMSV